MSSIYIVSNGICLMLGKRQCWDTYDTMGYHVSSEHVRHAIRATNSSLRWQGILTPRHPYSVPGPNSLWHVGMHLIMDVSVVYRDGRGSPASWPYI